MLFGEVSVLLLYISWYRACSAVVFYENKVNNNRISNKRHLGLLDNEKLFDSIQEIAETSRRTSTQTIPSVAIDKNEEDCLYEIRNLLSRLSARVYNLEKRNYPSVYSHMGMCAHTFLN